MILVEEKECEIGKRLSPFRCERVPENYFNKFFERYPRLCRLVFWEFHKQWLIDINARGWETRRGASKKWWNQPLSKKLCEIIQHDVNYKKSTFVSGHVLHRVGKVYRKIYNLGHAYSAYNAPGPSKLFILENDVIVSEHDRH